MFLVQGAAESIDPEESVFIPRILSMLSSIPKNNILSETSILMVGSLSEWLNVHPDQILVVMPILLEGVLQEPTSGPCSISLKDICQECSPMFQEDLICNIIRVCHVGLVQGKMKKKVLVRLVEIGGYSASALPFDKVLVQLEMVVVPIFEKLQQCLNEKPDNIPSRQKMEHVLNCFLGILRSVDPLEEPGGRTHPIVPIYSKLIAPFSQLGPWVVHEEIALSAMLCINKAVEMSREELTSLIPTTCEILLTFFSATKFSCILDSAALVIGMFASNEMCKNPVTTMFSMFFEESLNKIRSSQLSELQPDYLQGFMNLLTRVLKTEPWLLMSDADRQKSSLECGIYLLQCPETPTIKTACHFLSTIITNPQLKEGQPSVISLMGQQLVTVIMSCIGGAAPRHTMDHFAELILVVNHYYVSQLNTWVANVFQIENFPSTSVTPQQKEQFQRAILREKVNKRRMKDIVNDFAIICRGLKGTAYVQ